MSSGIDWDSIFDEDPPQSAKSEVAKEWVSASIAQQGALSVFLPTAVSTVFSSTIKALYKVDKEAAKAMLDDLVSQMLEELNKNKERMKKILLEASDRFPPDLIDYVRNYIDVEQEEKVTQLTQKLNDKFEQTGEVSREDIHHLIRIAGSVFDDLVDVTKNLPDSFKEGSHSRSTSIDVRILPTHGEFYPARIVYPNVFPAHCKVKGGEPVDLDDMEIAKYMEEWTKNKETGE